MAVMASLVCVGAHLHCAALAQEQAPGVYRTPGEAQPKEAVEIDSGWVVAYGVLLPRPYRVEFRDDTVRINDIPYNPRRRAKPDTTITMPHPKFDIEHALVRTYVEEYRLHGEVAAQQKVLEKFQPDSLIATVQFDSMGDFATITWTDGQSELLLLYSWLDTYPSKEELLLQSKRYLEGHLRAGDMITFEGLDVSYTIAEQIIQTVRDIKSGKLPIEAGKLKLKGLSNAKLAQDILDNLDHW